MPCHGGEGGDLAALAERKWWVYPAGLPRGHSEKINGSTKVALSQTAASNRIRIALSHEIRRAVTVNSFIRLNR